MSEKENCALSFDGVPIHYEVHGEGITSLVFVHGWCCDRTYWDQQLRHFSEHYQVVTVDLAGHGASGLDRRTWTMAAFGRDVAAISEHLRLEQMVLIGHSMGGAVIAEAARQISGKVIGLVGVDTYRNLDQKRIPDNLDDISGSWRANFMATTRNKVRNMFLPTSDPTLVEKVVAKMSAAPPEVGVGSLIALRRHGPNLSQVLKEIQVPITAINSDYYPNNLETLASNGIEVMLMSRVGHFVMIEDPKVFNRLLDQALLKFS